jgi:hypothetical protein
MSELKEFCVGEWIETMDGICQVLGAEKYVVEDFFKADFPQLSPGEVFDNKVVYKIFCSFDGKPRKTKFITHYSSKWCDPLSDKYIKIRDRAIEEHPDIYQKFEKRVIEKPILSSVEFSVRVDPKRKHEIVENLNKILSKFEKKHSFNEVQEVIYKNIDGILSKRLTNNDTLQTNVLISLKYNVLESNKGEFAFIYGKASGTYCADDE